MSKFFVFFILIFFFSCIVLKKTTNEYNYNGKAEIIKKEETQNFKFNLKFDSLLNAEIRIYALAGLKIADLIITDTSVNVKYLIDEDYKGLIVSEFSNINKRICLKKLIFELATRSTDKMIFNEKCFSVFKNKISDSYDVVNKSSEKILEISDLKISEKKGKRKFTISLPETIVKLELNSKSDK